VGAQVNRIIRLIEQTTAAQREHAEFVSNKFAVFDLEVWRKLSRLPLGKIPDDFDPDKERKQRGCCDSPKSD
jgi:hypothetical protein